MRRDRRGVWRGLAVTFAALLVLGVPALVMAVQADPCPENGLPCPASSRLLEPIFWTVITLFAASWWAAAWSWRWWDGAD